MNLHSTQPYWLVKDGIIDNYSSLSQDISVDVAVIGAGISGALAAYYLRNSGMSIAVVDRRHVGMGSTAASTAFLQYEIDTPLTKLCGMVGEEDAVRSYELCRKAIYDVGTICKKLHPQFDFHVRPSLQYASFKKHRNDLEAEYKMRIKHGFDVQWLEPEDIQKKFGFDAPAAIYSADGGEVDAYMLTYALLKVVANRGHGVYTNTDVKDITHGKRGVTLTTATGSTIKARKLVIAAGYESLRYVPKHIADIHSTYALVSEPIAKEYLWHKNSLVWETANPYMYFRIVNGNRVLLGGKDDKFHNPHIRDARIKRKSDMLLHSFSQKLPDIPIRADFCWAGGFAITKDGLPYIGSIADRPNTLFALGYGGNGITFSIMAAEIIRDTLMGQKNDFAHIFRFNR